MMQSPWIIKRRKELDLPPEMEAFDVWCEDLKQRPQIDSDAQILVSGRVRKGKSTLAYKVAKRLDPTFDSSRMVFNIRQFRAVADELPDGQELPPGEVRCVVWDEIIEGGMSRDWNTKPNKEMMKFFVVCGERNLIGFQLAPHIDAFDPFLRTMRATDWIMIPKRGQSKGHVRGDGGDYPGRRPAWTDIFQKRFTKEDSPDFEKYKELKRSQTRKIGDELSSVDGLNPFLDASLHLEPRL
jgi:hypothetical protein